LAIALAAGAGAVGADEPAQKPPAPLLSEKVVLEVDPEVGRVRPFEADEKTLALVMTGNPRITTGEGLVVKARTMVAWVDRKQADAMSGFVGGGATETAPAPVVPVPAGGKKSRASVLPDALVGIYAEGGVDLVTGGLAFRGYALYVDPRTKHALLIEPRFDTTSALVAGKADVPIHVSARRARIVAEGLAVFDDAEVATTRANDRILLHVRTLTVEEYAEAVGDEPLFMGFRKKGNPRFHGEGMTVRGERVPLFYWPEASFGGEEGRFPVGIRRASAGQRSSFGWWGFVGIGGEFGEGRWLDAILDVGGYTKRGPAAGLDLKWKRESKTGRPAVRGRLQTFYVDDATGDDRIGPDAPTHDRWLEKLENRVEVTRTLRFDLEVNDASDRGVNREYFEQDERNHKDRETVASMRWMQGGTAATITGKAHLRDYVTETTEQPQVKVWSESLPLTHGRPALDLSSVVRAGWLTRKFDDEVDDAIDYSARRIDVEERVYAPFDLRDLKVSPFVGARVTDYAQRSDGGPDVTRSAGEAGLHANLQLHKDYDVFGGPLGLDGARHVVDLDGGVFARFWDDTKPEDVPFFDLVDEEETRTEVFFQVRSRLDTRRLQAFGGRGNATVVDLAARLSLWPDGRGPYGQRGDGELKTTLAAELLPDVLTTRGEAVWSFDPSTLDRASIGATWTPDEWFSVGAGIRHVRDDVRAFWVDSFVRWNEKWGARVSIVHDFAKGTRNQTLKVSVLRFGLDHMLAFGVTARHGGDDLSVFLDFSPAIGGTPTDAPFISHEDLDLEP
jgi:hypothetical protein